MDKAVKGTSNLGVKIPTSHEATPDSGPAGQRSGLTKIAGNIEGAWVREDGAICFGGECVVIHQADNGDCNIDINPSECGTETGKAVVNKLMDNFVGGKPINVRIMPGQPQELK